jgi:exopolyphosphatase / guanosine-5'-triphosphate,3'-diphosphate pyrophosphatase
MASAGLRRVAAIDCGTNSLRLLIADIDQGRGELADLHRRMEIVRLGEGVDATGLLAPQALARTFAMLEEFARTIADSGASAVRVVATSATRDAANAADFTAGVTRILGVAPEVISGDEEAYLSFRGATAEFGVLAGLPGDDSAPARGWDAHAPEPPFLVVDLGGGSTEFVLGPDDGSMGAASDAARTSHGLFALSVNIGCVRLTERHLHSDPPGEQQIAAATADVDAALDHVAAAIPVAKARTLVGLAGSVTTLTAVALDLPGYDPVRIHHARIPAARMHEVVGSLLRQNRAERARNSAIHPGRVDVIGAGGLILDRVMSRFGFSEMVASDHDILDGIAWSIVSGRARRQ